LAAQSNNTIKRKFLSEKFKQPFTFEEAGPPSGYDNSSTQSNLSSTATQVSPTTAIANEVPNVINKSAYANIASRLHDAPGPFRPSRKFAVPFDESPTLSMLDSIAEQVDNNAKDVE
jgi:hypothetical protein